MNPTCISYFVEEYYLNCNLIRTLLYRPKLLSGLHCLINWKLSLKALMATTLMPHISSELTFPLVLVYFWQLKTLRWGSRGSNNKWVTFSYFFHSINFSGRKLSEKHVWLSENVMYVASVFDLVNLLKKRGWGGCGGKRPFTTPRIVI